MEVKENKDLIEYLQLQLEYEGPESTESTNQVYTLSKLNESSPEYKSIADRMEVRDGTKGDLTIASIEKVYNPYTLALFKLKAAEMGVTRESTLWHGTTESNVDNICKDNFDYRLVKQHLFGKGISFSHYFSYAFHYSVSKNEQFDKDYFVFLCKVIITKYHVGNKHTNYPMTGFDTTTKHNLDVIVKYDDDTFYPMYKIRFTSTPKKV